MEIEFIVPLIILIAFFAYGFFRIGKAIWSCFDHSWTVDNAKLHPGAKIVDINTEEVQYIKNGAKYKTTVRFSDGFTFVTHETEREDHFVSYKISLNKELYDQIIRSAIAAHDCALEKQQQPSRSVSKFEKKLLRQLKRQLKNNKN